MATGKGKIKEIHPEICFWALAGEPLEYSKKTKEGFEERLNILRRCNNKTDEIVTYALENYRRREVSKDDILDALAAAITALGPLKSLPDRPEFDDRGLPMQMLYRSPCVDENP
jgi:predicted RNase H-like nuclease